jgi:hypothetical protein
MAAKASEHQYKVLIERLQAQARETPQAYRTRVALLAALGYAALGLILLVALGLPVGIVIALLVSGRGFDPWALYVLLPQTVFAAMVVRALWLRFDAPSGYRLASDEAPALQAEIERLRIAAGAPPLGGSDRQRSQRRCGQPAATARSVGRPSLPGDRSAVDAPAGQRRTVGGDRA